MATFPCSGEFRLRPQTAGEARWRASGPLAEWNGVRDAAAFGPDPSQPASSRADTIRSSGLSEDALLLNI
jgi:carboxylesterase type B